MTNSIKNSLEIVWVDSKTIFSAALFWIPLRTRCSGLPKRRFAFESEPSAACITKECSIKGLDAILIYLGQSKTILIFSIIFGMETLFQGSKTAEI